MPHAIGSSARSLNSHSLMDVARLSIKPPRERKRPSVVNILSHPSRRGRHARGPGLDLVGPAPTTHPGVRGRERRLRKHDQHDAAGEHERSSAAPDRRARRRRPDTGIRSRAPPPTPRRKLVRHAAQGYGVAATSWRGSLALYPPTARTCGCRCPSPGAPRTSSRARAVPASRSRAPRPSPSAAPPRRTPCASASPRPRRARN
jgi:hypothetical protein